MKQISLYFGVATVAMALFCMDAYGQRFGGSAINRARQAIANQVQGGHTGTTNEGSGSQAQPDNPSPAPELPQANFHSMSGKTTEKGDQTPKVDRYALIIAMRDYPKSTQLGTLIGADQDALRLARVLKNGGYAEKNIIVVYDDASNQDCRPTRANILQQLQTLTEQAPESSLVSVFITGHGVAMSDKSYVCPSDATDSALSDPALAAKELIAVDDLAEQLSKKCKAANKLIVIDACRDTANNRTENYAKNVKALEDTYQDLWLITSCSNGQFSWMGDVNGKGERHAIFSYVIADGLEGNADVIGNNDGEVSLMELFAYAVVKTQEAVKTIHMDQTPELFGLAAPFPMASTSGFLAKRKLTTSDPQMEASRSADLLVDDVLVNLRSADGEFRYTVSTAKVTEQTIEQSNTVLHQYLCYMLGNRIQSALELNKDCKLAFVAKGLCYRTCEMYEEALAAFNAGGEHFSLFVRAEPGMTNHYVEHDEQGKVILNKDKQLLLRFNTAANDYNPKEYVALYEQPNNEKPKFTVKRQEKVRITKVQGDWLYVSAVNDAELNEGGWIHRDEVHWFPEAVDLYTPSTPMHRIAGAVNRLDTAANRLAELGERLRQPGERIRNAADRISAPIDRANFVLGFFGYSIPNPVRQYGYLAASYADIPSDYVFTVSGYVRAPAEIARSAQQWAGVSQYYYSGNQREEQVDNSRKELKEAGKLEPVKEKPVVMIEVSLPKNKPDHGKHPR